MSKKLLSHIKTQAGFTLIELLIVIVIIVILVSIGAAAYSTLARNARNAQRQSDLAKIAEALEGYYADHGTYPNTNIGGQFESAGRDCQFDKICCLLRGTVAQNVQASPPSTWKCIPPFNVYIEQKNLLGSFGFVHTYSGIPKDPLIDSNEYLPSATAGNGYTYASDGQSYVLTSQKYEGTPPTENAFSSTFSPYYWNRALAWYNDSAFWAGQIAIKGGHREPPVP